MTRYVDTSAVLRLLFGEPGPALTLARGDHVVSSALLEVEAVRAIERQRLTAASPTGRPPCAEGADRPPRHARPHADGPHGHRARRAPFGLNVRAMDALHVASAEVLAAEIGEAVEFWTHDERQRLAALSRGLAVFGI